MTAAVCVVRSGPVNDRFFAVKKQNLDRQWIATAFEPPGELDQKRRTRAAVVRADESKRKLLRVVVPANHEAILACAGNGRDEVDHVNAAGRCLIVPGLFGDW